MYISIERNQLNITTAGAIRPRPNPPANALNVLLEISDGRPRLVFDGVDDSGWAQLAQALDEARKQVEAAARARGERRVVLEMERIVVDRTG